MSPGAGKYWKWRVTSLTPRAQLMFGAVAFGAVCSLTHQSLGAGGLMLWWRKGWTVSRPLGTLGQVEAPFPLGLEARPRLMSPQGAGPGQDEENRPALTSVRAGAPLQGRALRLLGIREAGRGLRRTAQLL